MSSLLDSSLLSQPIKPQPNPAAMIWWHKQDAASLWISAVTIQEIRYGIELTPQGPRKQVLEYWLAHSVLTRFRGRILPVDQAVADLSGRLLALAKKAGHTAEVADSLIGATAKVHGCEVATLNRKHFEKLGVELVDF